MRNQCGHWSSPGSDGLQGHMAEEVGHRLAVVGSPNGLRKDHGYVYDLYLGTGLHLLFLRDGVGHDHGLEGGVVDA